MSDENKITVNLDLNKLLEAYSKPDFMKGVLIEFLKQNPNTIAQHLRDVVLVEILKSTKIGEITAAVDAAIVKKVNESGFAESYEFKRLFTSAIDAGIKSKQHAIDGLVSREIQKPEFTERLNDMISRRINEIVFGALKHMGDE